MGNQWDSTTVRKWWWPHHSLSSSIWNTYYVWLLRCQSPSIRPDVLKVTLSGDTVPCVRVLLQTWVSSPFTLIYLSATRPFRDWLVNSYIIIKNTSEKEGNWGQCPDIIVPKLPKKSCVKPAYITVPGFVCLELEQQRVRDGKYRSEIRDECVCQR